MACSNDVSVVMITRNRRDQVLRTLPELAALPGRPPVVVVDNGSTDDTPDTVERTFPDVCVVRLDRNAGSAGRNIGVRAVTTPYVAFADDDSWWAPDALTRASALLDANPRLAVVAARVLVGPNLMIDPTCLAMARTPLYTAPGEPGRTVLGFIACGAIVRVDAFLEVGGFAGMLGVGGEEQLLAVDLATAGWRLAYCDSVVAIHHPSPVRDTARRDRVVIRNALWSVWLRRPWPVVARRTARLAFDATRDAQTRTAFTEAVRSAPAVFSRRRAVPREIERQLRMVERS